MRIRAAAASLLAGGILRGASSDSQKPAQASSCRPIRVYDHHDHVHGRDALRRYAGDASTTLTAQSLLAASTDLR